MQKIIDASTTAVLPLGWQDESYAITVKFDVSAWRQAGDSGIVCLRHQRPYDHDGHLVSLVDNGDTVLWEVSATELVHAGGGYAQLFYTKEVDGRQEIVASHRWKTEIRKSVPVGRNPPEEFTAWYQSLLELATAAKASGDRMDAALSGGEAGQVLTQTESGIPEWQDPQGGGGGGGTWNTLVGKPFRTLGDTLKVNDGVLDVNTAAAVEQDNTLPITSAAVYTEVGNINAILELI